MDQQCERAFIHWFFPDSFGGSRNIPGGVIKAKYFRLLSAPGIIARLPIEQDPRPMLYAILCYHDEDAVGSWTKEQDAAVMKKLAVVQDKLTKQGRLGPVARLLPTTAATTLRKENPPVVLDGPFAETKEMLAGFTLIEADSMEEAVRMAHEQPWTKYGSIEVRPVGDMAAMRARVGA
jgi:hypothetical protein